MPRRSLPLDPSIGERIRARRELRGWSLRHAADRAGIAHTTWSRIEKGILRTDRYLISDLAAALECSVTDLTGQPYTPADRQLEAAQIEAERVWRMMMAHPLTEPASGSPPPPEQVSAQTALVRHLYGRCDYAGALRVLRDLLPAMHASKGRKSALELMIPAYGVAMGSLLNVGYPAYGWLAVERCAEAAQHLEDAVALAVTATNRARVLSGAGAYGPARTACDRAAADLEHGLAAPSALDLLGFLHLARAHHTAGLHDIRGAEEHLAEAARIAHRTGETESWDLAWGPRNVALWRIAFLLDTGRASEAAEAAAGLDLAGLPAVRQVYFYMDMGRCLAAQRRSRDAVRMLLAAERIAPQHTRSSAAARETARLMLHQGVGGSELRGLCERMGIAV